MDEELVAAMIAGVAEDAPWQAFVRRLRRRFGGSHANVIFRRPDLKTAFMTEDSSPAVLAFGDLTAHHRSELDPIPYFRMEPLRAYRIEEFAGNDAGAHPFIARFLAPFGMRHLILARVVSKEGLQAWLSVTRGEATGFNDGDLAALEAVARLFEPALGLFGQYREACDQRDAYARVVQSQATGLVRLDEHGSVIHCDSNARAMFDKGRALILAGEKLAAAAPDDSAALARAVALVTSGEEDEEVVVLHGPDGDSLELLLFRTSEPFDPARTKPTRAIGYLTGAATAAPPSPDRLRKLFGLTRREASLAVLLARGLNLADASRDLGVSDQTGRAYLRQIFQKTGVSRQAELVRRIQSGVAGIR